MGQCRTDKRPDIPSDNSTQWNTNEHCQGQCQREPEHIVRRTHEFIAAFALVAVSHAKQNDKYDIESKNGGTDDCAPVNEGFAALSDRLKAPIRPHTSPKVRQQQ